VPSRRIEDLHPCLQEKARQLIELCKAEGIEIRVTSTLRTFAEQAQLYAQGRTKPGQIVTRAKPGQSWHNYGLAVDVCPFFKGKPIWNSRHWNRIGALGKKLGLTWGGDWLHPKTDKPHFQMTFGTTLAEINRRHSAGLDVVTGKPLASA
jgi:peptidoglycan L-alanyl-D-glutamate endopeptidase CwlK